MKEKKVASLKIVFEDGSDYSAAFEVGLDKDEVAKYIERAFKPAEPLIKDEKVRKAVRAWAELNSIYSVFVEIPNIHGNARTILSGQKGYVEWMLRVGMPELEHNKTYTITELCGEEEE